MWRLRVVGSDRGARSGERRPERDLPVRRHTLADRLRRVGSTRARAARADRIRLRGGRGGRGGDDAGQRRRLPATSAPAAHARRHGRARPLRRRAGPPLAGAVPPRAGRSPLDRPCRCRARGSRRLEVDRHPARPLQRGLDVARGRGGDRPAALVPALLVGRSRARGEPRPARRGRRVRRDRADGRHPDARLAAARPPERLPAVPQGRRARAVLLRPKRSSPGSSRRPRRTSSPPR